MVCGVSQKEKKKERGKQVRKDRATLARRPDREVQFLVLNVRRQEAGQVGPSSSRVIVKGEKILPQVTTTKGAL